MADVFADTDAGIAPVRDSLNAAIQELCLVTGAYTRVYHLPLYTGRFFYRMSWAKDHFGWVVECRNRGAQKFLTQTDIATLSLQDPWFLKNSGSPDQYMQIGYRYIGFDKAPSSSGEVLEITCAVIPGAYTSATDPIKLRPVFQQAASQYAAMEFYASRGDATRANELHPKQPERTFVIGKGDSWPRSTPA
jgi:hypothetical protein